MTGPGMSRLPALHIAAVAPVHHHPLTITCGLHPLTQTNLLLSLSLPLPRGGHATRGCQCRLSSFVCRCLTVLGHHCFLFIFHCMPPAAIAVVANNSYLSMRFIVFHFCLTFTWKRTVKALRSQITITSWEARTYEHISIC